MDAQALEHAIAEASEDPARREALLSSLAAARLAVPLDKGLENGVLPADARPLVLNADAGFPVIAVFTSPAKAAPWLQQQPAYAHCLVTEFAWVRGLARPPYGIAINPGYRYSLLIAPTEVTRLPQG